VHLTPSILNDDNPNRVDPDGWRPLIMSFAKVYGVAPGELLPSTLAQAPEDLYRSPDIDTARAIIT
jgi:hypothetical protein